MSTEHVLAMKMKQMYEHYLVRKQQRLVHQLSEKVCSNFSYDRLLKEIYFR
jgi:hypothetical protein